MKGYILNKVRVLTKKMTKTKQSGVALVITMMVMLTLVLISLSLIMQSNTEHLISQNEQDSFRALSYGEWAIDHANRKIRTYIVTVRPADLDPILNGTLNPIGAANLLGFKNNMDSSMSRVEITDDLEETVSGVDTLSGFTGNWEVFRLGVDEDGDNLYDGNIRTVVYARVMDNFDPTGYPDTDDTDLRLRLEVRTIFPVFVDLSDNAEEVNFGGTGQNVIATRGQSERHLVARFAPLGSVAIRSDSDMDIHGSLDICGECGSAHANGVMDFHGSPTACGSVTGTEGFEYGGGTILGDSGTQPEIYIPIINPYNSLFVPKPVIFNTSVDTSLPAFLRCAGPSANDPGNSKYFAIVKVTSSTTQIYKAYRNYGDTSPPGPDTRWVWRLIGDSSVEALDTIQLDNCGRVVDCGVAGCEADKYLDPITSLVVTASQGVDPENNTFYGWRPDNKLDPDPCPDSGEFETVPNTEYTGVVDGSNSNQNDWNVNNFPQVALASNPYDTPVTSTLSHTAYCGGSCSFAGVLPGVGNAVPDETGDNQGDWDTSFKFKDGEVKISGGDIYAPLYNAVIFVYAGSADFTGNLSQLRYYDTGTSDGGATIDINDDPLFDLDYTWRLTVIGFGDVKAGGTTNLNPPAGDPDFRWGVVAGRDLVLHGNANDMACSTTDCDDSPTETELDFAGAYLAHESIGFNGTVGVNGYVIAEDRASCSPLQDETIVNGSLDIHYDCTNPPDFWSTESVRMRDWEEAQRVQ